MNTCYRNFNTTTAHNRCCLLTREWCLVKIVYHSSNIAKINPPNGASRLLYSLTAEMVTYTMLYVGKSDDSLHPELGATGNVVRRLMNGLENQGHNVFVDRFYSAPILFKYLASHGIHACGTAMTNRHHFLKQIVTTKRQLSRGQHKFLCCNNMTVVAWCDRRPIYFLSTYHDPTTSNNDINQSEKQRWDDICSFVSSASCRLQLIYGRCRSQ